MTASDLLSPVVTQSATFICWFAVGLLGFSIIGMIGRR